MKTIFSKEQQVVTQPAPPPRKIYGLEDLFNELGTMKWSGNDKSWDNAINAVREEIKKMVVANR
jgi:hypothetical protein